MKKTTISYIHSTDSYYFHSKEIYVKRWMFLYAEAGYLAMILGLDDISTKDRDALFALLGSETPTRPDHYLIDLPNTEIGG